MNPLAAFSLTPASRPVPAHQMASGSPSEPTSDLGPLTSSSSPMGEEWLALPAVLRTEILTLLECFARIERAPAVKPACKHIAASGLAHLRGFSAPSLERKYRTWQKASRDWRALIDRSKAPKFADRRGHQLPEDFKDFFRMLAENNQRKSRPAMRKLLSLWHAGRPVPGYGTWAEWFAATYPDTPLPRRCTETPRGWSYRNLYRVLPCKRELALARRGIGAAHAHVPHVARSTAELRPMELIALDDFETDIMTVWSRSIDGRKPGVYRTGGVRAIDVATRRTLSWGLKARAEDEEGRAIGIRREDVREILVNLFREHGLPDYPVTLLVENAAAAITPELEEQILTSFAGQVRVERTGLINRAVQPHGFAEKGGKPWLKSWIESSFNLMHNEAGDLPGQKGSRYDNAPGDLSQKIRYTTNLIKAAERSPETLAELEFPFLTTEQAVEAFGQIFDRMDARTDHQLEGFEELTVWRHGPGDGWRPLDELAALAPSEQTQVEISRVKQSPLGRWKALARQVRFTRVPEHALACFMSGRREVRVESGRIRFIDQGRPHTFFAAGLGVLRDGAAFTARFDGRDPTAVHLFDPAGRYRGSVPRFEPVDIRDKDALARAAGKTSTVFARSLADVRERHAAQDEELAAARQRNADRLEALVAPELIDEGEPSAARPKTRRRGIDLDQLLPDAADPAADDETDLSRLL